MPKSTSTRATRVEQSPATQVPAVPAPRARGARPRPEPLLSRVPDDMVPRARLTSVLQRGVSGPLTLLSAPAGYGKTLAVAAWAEQRANDAAPLSVLTLREEHQSLRGFWAAALAALAAGGLDLTGVAEPSAGSDVRVVRAVSRALAARGEPTIWVLDCAEQDLAEGLARGLDRLLSLSGGQLRLVLLTRADPPLPLHRYRLSGEVTELRAADLVFRTTEIAALLKRTGLTVTPRDVATLRSRTGGWPAGIRFAAIALQQSEDVASAVADFRGDTGNVAAYLMNEVFARQTPAMAAYLLRTCVVQEVTPQVVAALTGQDCDQERLAEIARSTSFLEQVPGRPGRYTHPSVFRQFLRSQLAWTDPGLEADLHRAAAHHLAGNGEPTAALQHAMDARDWDLACDLLIHRIGVGGVLTGPRAGELRALVASVPHGAPGASAALTRAALALAEHDLPQCSAGLEQAKWALEAAGADHAHVARLAHACLAAIAASLGPDQDSALGLVTAADVALGLAADEGAGHPSADLVGLVAGARARVLLLRGDFAVATRALEAGVRASDGTRLTALHQDLQGMAALVAAVSGHLRAAAQTTHRLLAHADDAGAPRSAVVALAWIRMDEYSLAAVDQLLDSARERGGGFDSRLLSVVLALLQARLDIARGHLAVARSGLLAAASANPQFGPDTWLGRTLLIEQASTHLAQDQPLAGLALLAEAGLTGPDVDLEPVRHRALRLAGLPIPDLATPPASRLATWPLERQLTWAFTLAEQAERHEDHVAAMEQLATALRHAATERLRRPFLEAEGPLLELIAQAPANLTRWLRVPDPAGSFEGVLSTSAGSTRHATDELLTRKEAEVLGYLSILLTTDEIAETMFVSVNTVRSHVRSVLRKLQVARRNDAVRRAWDLGLIPRPVLGRERGGGTSSPAS